MQASARREGSLRARVTLAIVVLLLLSVSRLALASELSSQRIQPAAHKKAHRARLQVPRTAPPVSAHDLLSHRLFEHASTLLATVPKSRRPGKPYVLPVARRFITRDELHAPHHDYPAWDLPVPVGTRVVAVRGGLVLEVTRSGRCGNGVIILATDHYLYTYCHGSEVKVHPADKVATGQPIMLSGQSGHATGPHLHLQIESPSGDLLCPQSLVTSWFNGGHKGPGSATSKGCFYLSASSKHHHRKQQHRHQHRARDRHHQPGDHRSKKRQRKPRPTPSPTPTPTATATATPTPLPSPSGTPTPLPTPSLT
jgi:murein DD-endopeptidase MepM/ murein hydrolase activator NlpD